MYFANDENGVRVFIDNTEAGKRYVCPACGNPMITKKGRVVAHHFAHKCRECCDPWYVHKMSKWHRDMQSKFPLSTLEITVYNKERTEYHIADAFVHYKDKNYVFEFQHSPILSSEFISRTEFYLNLGCSVIWIFDYQPPKCIYYKQEATSGRIREVHWPGIDRVRFFDSEILRTFLSNTSCNEKGNLSVFFYVLTGPGTEKLHANDSLWYYKWEYINPFERETFFIKPDFRSSDSLADFQAAFFTEDEFDNRIWKICRVRNDC